jgi:HD-GYP domain-containing protein (c-di-GMP phosphodiesterase class II)/GAF domain-containing protein
MFKYSEESGHTGGLYWIVLSFVLIGLSVGLREFLFLTIGYRPLVFLIGNIGILLSCLVLLRGVEQTAKEVQRHIKMPQRARLYSVVLFIVALYPALQGKYLSSLELLFYASMVYVIFITMGKLYMLAKEQRPKMKVLMALFAVSLFLSLFIRSFGLIESSNAYTIYRLIGYSGRIVVLVLLFFEFRRIGFIEAKYKKEAVLYPIEAHFVKGTIKTYIIVAIIASILSYFALSMFQFTFNTHVKEEFSHLSQSTTIVNFILKGEFDGIRNDLILLSKNKEIAGFSQNTEADIEEFYNINKEILLDVSRMDVDGKVIFAYPDKGKIGKDISNEPHVSMVLETHGEVLSDPLRTADGFAAVVFHQPVFKDGKFDGTVSILMNLDFLFLLNNVKTIFDCYPADLDGTVDTSLGQILVKSSPVELLPGKIYIAAEWMHQGVFLKQFTAEHFGYFFMPFTFLIGFVILLKKTWDLAGEHAHDLRLIIDEEMKDLKILSDKLSDVIEFFPNINISQDINVFSEKLLDIALALLDKGEAGSVMLKEGSGYKFTAVRGYDKSPLDGVYLTSKEVMVPKEDRPIIIPNIFTNVLVRTLYRAKTRKALEKAGSSRIKATIHTPFVIDGEYIGGLFIDNFHSESAFSETDLKIVSSISKLGLVYLRNMLLLRRAQSAEEKFYHAITSFAELDIRMKESEFFDRILDIGRSLVPAADAGTVTLKSDDHFRYVAVSGFDKDVLLNTILKKEDAFIPSTKEVFVIKKILNRNISEELKVRLSKVGVDKIKQTLITPIIASGEYFGAIFLDSFKDGEVFTEEDRYLTTALSKLSSAFASNLISYVKLEDLVGFNEISLSLFHEMDPKKGREEVIKKAFEILSNLYPDEIEEVGIGEGGGNAIVLTKFNGEHIEKHSLKKKGKGLIQDVLKEKHSFFVSLSSPPFDLSDKNEKEKKHWAEAVVFSGREEIPIFRIRFNTTKMFSAEEEEFFERFGREIIVMYGSALSFEEIKELFIKYITSLVNAINSRDPYTKGHSERVASLSCLISEKMKLGREEQRKILFAAILHDIGKIGVPEEILAKTGKLTKDEYAVVQKHVESGKNIVFPMDPEIAEIIAAHHERWDGAGYPAGLKREKIPIYSRVITVADVFDALITDRPYRKAFSIKDAIKIIKEEKGTHFDPLVVDAFLSIPMKEIKKVLAKPDVISLIIQALE